jgi:hypothetical protein
MSEEENKQDLEQEVSESATATETTQPENAEQPVENADAPAEGQGTPENVEVPADESAS